MSTNNADKPQHARSGSAMSSGKRSRPFSLSMNTPKRIPTPDRTSEGSAALAIGDRPYNSPRQRAGSTSSQGTQALGRTPARSFFHRSFHGQPDLIQYSSDGLRDQTAELASLAYPDNGSDDGSQDGSPTTSEAGDGYPAAIAEVSEPVSPEESDHEGIGDRAVSALSNMIQRSPPRQAADTSEETSRPSFNNEDPFRHLNQEETDEQAPLLRDRKASQGYQTLDDVEGQTPGKMHTYYELGATVARKTKSCWYTTTHPKTWSAATVYNEVVVHPCSKLPAVFLGLLLNILDALSYGMILFPLGHSVFDGLGSDGIAMFYVSTIIAQLVYSSGGSIFKGGIGSEMIEVVPFFHKMAFTILERVGEDNQHSVLATTILSFSISAVLTGIVFFLMGACGLGSLIGFFPRHILIGCIGGVGWFLVVTGIEVSARLPGNLEYNLETVQQLFRSDTILLWLIPLILAITLMIVQRFVKSNFLVGGYFISIAAIFYFFKFAMNIEMDTLHSRGWVFDSPPAGNPWYHFYTLYDMKAVHWGALADTIPTMFALTFFGVLHVPINVPALGISTGEDNLNVDRELVAHGVSNCLSGLFGSVQNYLVYTNSLLFMDSGGNDRLAGIMLAAATFGILLAGPVIIGYIPIMVVGALIFLLGIELLEEAVVGTFGKVHKLEYITILVIVVTMGVWDFVVGILVGIVLAALNFVVQTSRRTAIRATYSGSVAHSTVRRPPNQLKFLKETGQQIFVIKLAGFLFFGTIVGVENKIRALLAEEAFNSQPLRYVVLDMSSINGIDFSAAEAFTRVNRLLQKRDVQLVVSGLDLESEIGLALRNVGLYGEAAEVKFFETLNQALENCENQLLTALYRQQESRRKKSARTPAHLDVPRKQHHSGDWSSSYRQEFMVSSPRRHQLHTAATTTLEEDTSSGQKWTTFKQPLPLMLQIFEDVSDKTEDFWHRAVPYFEQMHYPKDSILFQTGDQPNNFYLLEEGILRADYDLPQGKYSELIVAGRPCGELPFFSDTLRTANMVAEKDCSVWQLTGPKWRQLQARQPEVAQELLKISLKLTKERMDVITSYVLTMAG